MNIQAFGTRIRELLPRPRARLALPPVPRTQARALTAEELGQYDLVCRQLHGGPAPVAGTVYEEHPAWGDRILVYDLVCPRGHDYRYKRTVGRPLSPADLASDYLACPYSVHNDAAPSSGTVYTRDLDNPMQDILVRELYCSIDGHRYLYETDGG